MILPGPPPVTGPVTRCDCCDLPVESCGKPAEDRARQADLAERRRLLALPGVFEAAYPGPCQACPDPIRPGDPIMRGTGSPHYVHAADRHPF
jgi:hypothetical protein